MSQKYQLVIFDLDGTLLDTSPGIYNSVRCAERHMGFDPITDDRLREFVGPPPKQMYMKIYGVDEATALEAVKWHREYGRKKAIYEATVYPGMLQVLNQLKEHNFRLAVSTLKSQEIAESVLDNFGIKKYFDAICGMNEQETFTKCQTIRSAMSRINDCKNAVMIGDSLYDCIGALEAQVAFIAVTYGFGFTKESEIQYPHVGAASSPSEIYNIIINAL